MIDYRHMVRNSVASKSFWRAALTCGLCVLAFAFFIEAKTSWYGPASGPGSDVRSSKAMPADMPRLIEHGVPIPDPIHPQVPFVLLPVHAALPPAADQPVRQEAAHPRPKHFLSRFSIHLFFRPPPTIS
jgi:hypothetical protein